MSISGNIPARKPITKTKTIFFLLEKLCGSEAPRTP
jgi:hypothetical protein